MKNWGVFLLILCSQVSLAGGMEEAISCYENSDYECAIQIYNDLSNVGDDRAQLNLAKMYINGVGVEVNHSKAKYFVAKSAELGNPEALFLMEVVYLGGYGEEKDVDKAAEFFGLSCDASYMASCDEYFKLIQRH